MSILRAHVCMCEGMCACMYDVNMYKHIYVCEYASIDICVHASIHICSDKVTCDIYIHIYACIYTCVCSDMASFFIHTHTHTHTHAHNLHTHTHTHTILLSSFKRTHEHTHPYIHTHTQSLFPHPHTQTHLRPSESLAAAAGSACARSCAPGAWSRGAARW